MSFGAYATAAMMRDTIKSVIMETLQVERPRYRYATVDSVNQTTKRAFVKFSGEANAVPVRYGSTIPKEGAVVRVGGLTGDRHIEDIILGDFEIIGGGPPAGATMGYSGDTAPEGWLFCHGQAVSRTTYADLFAAISTKHGNGNGSTTFNLPDHRGRFRVGAGGTYAIGDTGGVNVVSLNVAQMPEHSHAGPSHVHNMPNHDHGSGNLNTGNTSHTHNFVMARTNTSADTDHRHHHGGWPGAMATHTPGTPSTTTANEGPVQSVGHSHNVAGNTGSANPGPTNAGGTQQTSSVGGGGSHENRPPYIAEHVIIKT